jgi:hypothetical protein
MNQTCPQCYSQLASSEVGNLCVNCGYLQRRHHNHAPVQDSDSVDPTGSHHEHDDHIVPGNLEAPKGLDALLFSPEETVDPQPDPQSSPMTEAQAPLSTEKPQIINHHTSSQYRRRLEKQLQSLETPEIESPLEPSSNLEAPETTPKSPQSTHSEYVALYAAQPGEPAESAQEDIIEVDEPHRPSPYLINMSDSESTTPSQTPEYHSPLRTSPTPEHTEHHRDHPQPAPSQVDTPADSDAAMARAEALLAAAASPKKEASASKTNSIIIIVAIVILLALGGFLTYTLLPKPTTKSNETPSTASTSSQTTSPTPSNLTESAKRDAERKDTLNTIAIALAAYKKANGTYPSGNDIEVLSALTSSNPPYLREIKADPLSNAESGVIIKYGYNSDGTKFTLTASLENKQDADAVNGLYVVKSP